MNEAQAEEPLIRPLREWAEFAAVAAVRRQVFVLEQACPEEEEFDDWEAAATHFVIEWRGRIVGTARLYQPRPGMAKIGRVALLPEVRGRGWGADLIRAMERHLQALGVPEAELDSQVAVIPFYEKLGYVAEGPEFLDAGIPHRHMGRRLRCLGDSTRRNPQ